MRSKRKIWIGTTIVAAITALVLVGSSSEGESRWSHRLRLLQEARPLFFVRQVSSYAGDNYKLLSETFLLHGRFEQVSKQIERELKLENIGFRTRIKSKSKLYRVSGKRPHRGVIIEVRRDLSTMTYVVVYETADTNMLDNLALWVQRQRQGQQSS